MLPTYIFIVTYLDIYIFIVYYLQPVNVLKVKTLFTILVSVFLYSFIHSVNINVAVHRAVATISK